MALSEIIALITSTTTNTQLYDILNRVYLIVISVSALLIALLWIPIALGFFSSDENRKTDAKMKLKNAVYGTVIYVLAVSGVLYAVFQYVALGT
ncbi:MAG: hypothetical protein M1306_03310 [Candidatus Thermoplasmatota archaeon]|jgi:hypothetical protein|nr:hypothetical protein [Candidatus Thermoplasmatota archaeon]